MNESLTNLHALRGFLAAARHGSFTRAAAELHLTQSALSRQIQSLEEELETPLFVRTTRKVSVTPAGQRLADVAARALAEIDAVAQELRPHTGPRPITVTTFASFATLWLIPRLDRFARLQPGIDVHCMATDRVVDIDAEGVDIAFRGLPGRQAPPGTIMLFAERTSPVASPALLARLPVETPADLAKHTLLGWEQQYEARFPQFGWNYWFEQAGVAPVRPKNTLRFSNHDQIIQAALAGQGVALARTALVAEMLRDKQLIPILGGALDEDLIYCLVVSERARARPEVQAFIEWAKSEAALTTRMTARTTGGRR